jgi:hypothetical protein
LVLSIIPVIFFFKEFKANFHQTSRTTNEFEFCLSQLIELGSPALKALTCLEANEANPGDVYIFWHAVMWAIKDALVDPLLEYPTDAYVQEQVLGILNSRHNQIFGDGNLSASKDLYLSGAYLNPSVLQFLYLPYFMFMRSQLVYLTFDLFRKDLSQSSSMEGIEHILTFKTVTKFLVETAQNEILHSHREEFTRWKGRAGDFKQVYWMR